MTVKFLNNGHTKLSSTDCYESFGVTVGDLCFYLAFDYSVVGRKFRNADFSSRNISRDDAMEYFSSIVANLGAVIDKCVIVHRDSEGYC